MPENTIDLRCPKCRKSMKVAANADPTKPVTCPSCGRASKLDELKAPSGKSLGDQLVKVAKDAFKRVKGFKPKA